MNANHPVAQILSNMGAFGPSKAKVLDSAAKSKAMLDDADLAAANFAAADIRANTASAIAEWAETAPEDLDDGETLADRLDALLVGIADENQDGELTDDESSVIDAALNAGYDFLVSQGVSEDDAYALLNDGDADAASRVQELLKGSLTDADADTDPDAAAVADVDAFTFGDADATASALDSVLDAVTRKRGSSRKNRVSKRITGHVRLSSGQKVAVRKAGLKMRSAGARMHRIKKAPR